MLTLHGLPDEEIAHLSTQPRRIKKKIFRSSEEWLAANRERMEEQFPDAYLLINAANLTWAVGKDHDTAHETYINRFGRTPRPEGRTFLAQQLTPRPR